jgi:hypothetical protein
MLFPPGAAVSVTIDGKTPLAYNAARLVAGRVYAPVRPFVTGVAARTWFEGSTLVIVRGDRSVRISLRQRAPDALDRAYVPVGEIFRALGARVSYAAGRLDVRFAPALLATPSPFDAAAPSVPPSVVFTPIPSPTPRPTFTGIPYPRRTPIPAAAPTPRDL